MKFQDEKEGLSGEAAMRNSFVGRGLLCRMAGRRVYLRGQEYVRWGLVLDAVGGQGEALVAGTRVYRVGLRREAEGIVFHCDCPIGEAGRFCKHVVAVGLLRSGGDNLRRRVQVCEKGLEQAIRLLGEDEADRLGPQWCERAVALLDELLAG